MAKGTMVCRAVGATHSPLANPDPFTAKTPLHASSSL